MSDGTLTALNLSLNAWRIGAFKAAMRKVSVIHESDIKPLFDGIELEFITEQRYQLTPED